MPQNHLKGFQSAITRDICNQLIDDFNSDQNESKRLKGPRNIHMIQNNIQFYEYSLLNAGNSSFTKSLRSRLKEYRELNPFLMQLDWGIEETCQLQKYTPGQFYSIEHCEHSVARQKRILAWMFYLNDVFEGGGGTKFPQQDVVLNARAGDLYIWPAFWTFSHLGIPSTKEDKYIITGWCSFNTDNISFT